ncbi:MAG TPA: serine/threonine-protein kinase [Kofleriaceae bacterium]|nr:serine/threonine-protein kinase [Kofleriaceae bacterium]
MGEQFPIPLGRYQLVERLAVGGMAELFLATAPGEHGFAKQIVIKRLLPHLARETTYNAMFIDEAKLTARLVHPKIAQTYELGRVDDSLFIAMEYVDGIDVLAMLRECAHRHQRVPAEIAVYIAHEVLDALDYAHNLRDVDGRPLGVVHRDISPSNVLLSVRGDVKLVDFGIARAAAAGRAHQTKSGTLKGKYGYMSPEQVVELPLDARSDLFSVGIVLAEMLIGRRLFAAANELDVLLMVRDAKLTRLERFGADIEKGLDAILRRALRKPPEERWGTAAAFRDALGEWLFEHRQRITPRHVADIVEVLHGAVVERRRESMEGAGESTEVGEGAAPRAMNAGFDSQPVAAAGGGGGAARLIADAVVEAPMDGPDSMPLSISVEHEPAPAPAARAKPPSAPPATKPATPVAPAAPAAAPPRANTVARAPRVVVVPPKEPPKKPAAAPRAKSEGEIDFSDLAKELDLELEEAPPPKVEPRKHLVAKLHDADSTPTAIDELEQSVRYPSIEAAITALAPVAPDPAAIDFDDSAVEPAARSRDVRLPTAEELAAARPPQPPAVGEVDEAPDDTGDFASSPPLGVLFRLLTTRATGMLVVSVGGIKKEIYVRDGMPEFVSSNVASELLGNYLVSQNILSHGELAMALAMMPHYGGKLGDTLVGLGLLRPLEVFRQLTRQVRAKLIDVCSWTKGSFAWYAGRQNTREAFPLDLNAFEVLGAGAMAMPAALVDAWVGKHKSDHVKASKVVRLSPDRFEIPGLRDLYDSLDGRKSIGELLARYTDIEERMRTSRMMILLVQCEMAKP